VKLNPMTDDNMRSILKRQEALQSHHPQCQSCHSDQVQLIRKNAPARWKCRRCGNTYDSEPNN